MPSISDDQLQPPDLLTFRSSLHKLVHEFQHIERWISQLVKPAPFDCVGATAKAINEFEKRAVLARHPLDKSLPSSSSSILRVSRCDTEDRFSFVEESELTQPNVARHATLSLHAPAPSLHTSCSGLSSGRFSGVSSMGSATALVSFASRRPATVSEYDKGSSHRQNSPSEQVSMAEAWRVNEVSDAEIAEDMRERAKQAEELSKWFSALATDNKKYLPAQAILDFVNSVNFETPGRSLPWLENTINQLHSSLTDMRAQVLQKDEDAQVVPARGIPNSGRSSLVSVANSSHTSSHKSGLRITHASSASASRPRFSLSLDDFVDFVLWEDLKEFVDDRAVGDMLELREALIKVSVDLLIMDRAHLKCSRHCARKKTSFRHRRMAFLLEAVFGIVILLNALTIGMSADLKWRSFRTIEGVFTLLYTVELLLRYALFSLAETCCGSDWAWNLFDLALVFIGIIDISLSHFASSASQDDSDLGNLGLLRVVRLFKLLRLLRLLRFRIFKQLLLMVKGVVAGLRTLFWAIVLLLGVFFLLGLTMRQLIGQRKVRHQGMEIFPSVSESMLIVFECFTRDCNLRDGTPLVPFLYGRYGVGFVVPYYLASLFITIGIFNMIIATFVENVAESARQKRQLSSIEENVRVCRQMRELILRFGGVVPKRQPQPDRRPPKVPDQATASKDVPTSQTSSYTWFRDLASHGFRKNFTREGSVVFSVPIPSDARAVAFECGGQISRDSFELAVNDKVTLELLNELEIHVYDRSQLFDVLDADGSGMVDVSELISGLLKLRSGGADKSENVATFLGIRSLHQTVRAMMNENIVYQSVVYETQQRLEKMIISLESKALPLGF